MELLWIFLASEGIGIILWGVGTDRDDVSWMKVILIATGIASIITLLFAGAVLFT